MNQNLANRAIEVFGADVQHVPLTTLRGGDAIDGYSEPLPFDSAVDTISDVYMENHFWGVAHLDAASWRHYLPHLIGYALRHLGQGGNVTDALLSSLRPPDRDPPRLASLTPEQEQVVVTFLEVLAFDPASVQQDFACQVMQEWWVPDALYRKVPPNKTIVPPR